MKFLKTPVNTIFAVTMPVRGFYEIFHAEFRCKARFFKNTDMINKGFRCEFRVATTIRIAMRSSSVIIVTSVI